MTEPLPINWCRKEERRKRKEERIKRIECRIKKNGCRLLCGFLEISLLINLFNLCNQWQIKQIIKYKNE